MLEGIRRRASRATGRSVCQDPFPLRSSVLFPKTLGQIRPAPEVGLVGRPTAKNHGWYPTVVVVEVGCYESLEASERVELMEVQPPVPQLGLQLLDERTRLEDIDLGDHMLGKFVELTVRADGRVLGSTVGQDLDLLARGTRQRLPEDQSRTLGLC